MRIKQTAPVASETIRKLRTNNGWTQQELADKCGLGLRTIQGLEADGAFALPSATIQPIADVFGVSRKTLLKLPEEPEDESKLSRITVFINGTRQEIDETEELLRLLAAIFESRPDDPLIVVAIKEGSFGIEVLTTPHLIAQVLFYFLQNAYGFMRSSVSHLVIPADTMLPFSELAVILSMRFPFHFVTTSNGDIAVYRHELRQAPQSVT